MNLKKKTNFWLFIFNKKTLVLAIFLLCQNLFSQGYKIPEKPKFQTSLYDYIDLLSSSQKTRLEDKLVRYSDTTSTQIVVAIIKSTQGENIAYLAANWGEKWGIGQAKQDNGVLILLAKKDRKITIQTGKGVEHLLTDFASKRIIEREIIPHFKRGNFYKGLDKGTDAVFKTLLGEYQGTRKEDARGSNWESSFLSSSSSFFLSLFLEEIKIIEVAEEAIESVQWRVIFLKLLS